MSSHEATRFSTVTERTLLAPVDSAISAQCVPGEELVPHGHPIEAITAIQNPHDECYLPRETALERRGDGGSNTVSCHGMMAPWLELDIVVRAVDAIRDHHEPLALVLVGDRDDVLRLWSLIVPPYDPESLELAILELLRDPMARHDRAKKALRVIDEHEWPIQRRRYLDLIDNLPNST